MKIINQEASDYDGIIIIDNNNNEIKIPQRDIIQEKIRRFNNYYNNINRFLVFPWWYRLIPQKKMMKILDEIREVLNIKEYKEPTNIEIIQDLIK